MAIVEIIKKAGVVGCGGAGFPTDVKINNKAEFFLVNGMECEPMLRTDRYLMLNKSEEIVTAANIIGKHLEAQKVIIGVKKHYVDETKALNAAIRRLGYDIEVKGVDNFYPAGDEHVVVHQLTGRVVPAGGIPIDAGCVVNNVGTMLAVYHALHHIPVTDKYFTVAGEVECPTIVKAPIGTSFADCIRLAGGVKEGASFIVNGGPMMGKPLKDLDAPEAYVSKTTSGILVFRDDSFLAMRDPSLERSRKMAARHCIQCSYCTMLCPRYLLGHPIEPHKSMRLFALGENACLEKHTDVIRNAMYCSQCGTCEMYACPMGLQPNLVNAYIKEQAALLGVRSQKLESGAPHAERHWRNIPSGRLAKRIGVGDYYHVEIKNMVEACPNKVRIKLKQGVGSSAVPVVSTGEYVEKGDVIAEVQGNRLGSRIHASISGRVVAIDDAIVIGG